MPREPKSDRELQRAADRFERFLAVVLANFDTRRAAARAARIAKEWT